MAISINDHLEALSELEHSTTLALKTARRRNNQRIEMIGLADVHEDPNIALTQTQIDGMIATQLAVTQALQFHLDAAIAAMTP